MLPAQGEGEEEELNGFSTFCPEDLAQPGNQNFHLLPEATELGSGQVEPQSVWIQSLYPNLGRVGLLGTSQTWWGWDAHCLLNESDSSIFLGLPLGLWGRKKYLKEPCCPLGLGLSLYPGQ